jgi:hypothetical protein
MLKHPVPRTRNRKSGIGVPPIGYLIHRQDADASLPRHKAEAAVPHDSYFVNGSVRAIAAANDKVHNAKKS